MLDGQFKDMQDMHMIFTNIGTVAWSSVDLQVTAEVGRMFYFVLLHATVMFGSVAMFVLLQYACHCDVWKWFCTSALCLSL